MKGLLQVTPAIAVAALSAGVTLAVVDAEAERTSRTGIQRQIDGLAMAAQDFGQADVLIVGDSIMLRTPIRCGESMFKMAVASVTAREVATSAVAASRAIKPRVAIVGLGANDELLFGEPAVALRELENSPHRIIWVATPNSPKTNALIEQMAAKRGERVYRYRGRTVDGAHPDRAGRRRMARDLSNMCEAELRRHVAISP